MRPMPYNALLQAQKTLLRVGSMCGLGLDIIGIHSFSFAARYTTGSNSGTLANCLAKIQATREYDRAPVYAVTSEWKEKS